MKSKIKTNKKIVKSRIKRAKHYPEFYLALVIVSMLLLEGALFGATSRVNWQEASQVLDLNPALSQTQVELAVVFAPMVSAVEGVNEFYQQAADAATPLLDLSGSDNEVALVINSITEFYQQASIQMTQLLDFSGVIPSVGSVSGIAIENNQ